MPGLVCHYSLKECDNKLLEKMIDSLKHEDFHKVETYADSNFACARIHLGIFNAEPQPVFNEDKSIYVFIEGKIYGYENELNNLKNKGYKFVKENDAEFCLNSYINNGKDFIKNLNGNFVILIYDLRSKKVIVANDRFGFRGHYYCLHNDGLILAPEIKAILQADNFNKELDKIGVSQYFAFGEFWDKTTFFKNINLLPPATILTYDGINITLEKYWELQYIADYSKTEKEYSEELVHALKVSIERRMKEELKYGITLSGGLDSRSVLLSVPSEKMKDILACSFGLEDCDEVKIAKEVVKKLGIINHIFLEIRPSTILDYAEEFIWLNDGRSYVGVAFQYPTAKILRDRVDLVFDGFAMDLTLGGSYLTKERIRCENEQALIDSLSRRRIFNDDELKNLFLPDYYEKVKDIPKKSIREEFGKLKSSLPGNKSDEFFMNTHVAWITIGSLLYRNFLEISHPTLDNDFFDIIVKIPPEWRLNYHIYKKFLKKLSPEISKIPYNKIMIRPTSPNILWEIARIYLIRKERLKKKLNIITGGKIFLHNKRSYISFDEWFITDKEWQNYFKEILFGNDIISKNIFNPDYIKFLFEEQISGKNNNSLKLIYLTSFKLFLKKYFL